VSQGSVPDRDDVASTMLPPVTERLTLAPATGPILARALGRSVTGAARRAGGGVELPSRRVEVVDQQVDLQQWAHYARVCGMSLSTMLPGTFLHVMAFGAQVKVMGAPDFPFPMVGMVHIRNEMQMLAQVNLQDRLTLSAWAQAVRPHRQGTTVDLHARAEQGGDVVWRGTSTYLVRGVDRGEVGVARGEVEEGPTSQPSFPAEADLDPATLQPWAHWRLPADLGRRYGSASGDVNPIHLNPLAARALGFPRTIAHGMWTHARVLAALQGRIPPRHAVAVSFRKPVLLPSTVVFRAMPTSAGHVFAVTDRTGEREHLRGSVAALA